MLPWALLGTLLLLRGGEVVNGQSATGCNQPGEINNGDIILSNGLNVGSTLVFACPRGYFPYPVGSRRCRENGEWTRMATRTGRTVTKAYCKEIKCPKPDTFEHGSYNPPRNSYAINSTLTFDCIDGYNLRGSAERTCLPNGKWSGTTAICDNGAGHCPNPGIPLGATKTGSRYQIDAKVRYYCTKDLDLIGSDVRVCQESHEWTGTEPSCLYPYTFDLPEDVKAQFDTSLLNILDQVNPFKRKQANLGRKITIVKNGILNVYLLVDASESVGEDNFEVFKESVTFLIDAISKFDVFAHFGILSYATEPKVVVNVYDDDSDKTAELLEHVNTEMLYSDHKDKSGTNIRGALEEAYKMMVQQRHVIKEDVWKTIRHVVLLLTDGKSNMGGTPKDAVKKIHNFLEIDANRTDFLDIYAFGIKALEVDRAELNDIASKKSGEQHVWVMESAEDLKTTFEKILDTKGTQDMCGLSSEDPDAVVQLKAPWHVVIKEKGSSCRGSLVAKDWVLTAAHCFHKDFDMKLARVEVAGSDHKISKIEPHPCYNVSRLKAEKIEDYDYDVALLKLETPVNFSAVARPICIPCTVSANRALKMSGLKTCKDHKDELLDVSELEAAYVNINTRIYRPKIMVNDKRDACTREILKWDGFNHIKDVSKVMRPRYLCSREDATCKGDSGGALYVTKRRRHYELGVISWGVHNACDKTKKRRPPPPGRSPTDFHISLFEVQPWLRQHLGKDLEFLPDEEVRSECPE